MYTVYLCKNSCPSSFPADHTKSAYFSIMCSCRLSAVLGNNRRDGTVPSQAKITQGCWCCLRVAEKLLLCGIRLGLSEALIVEAMSRRLRAAWAFPDVLDTCTDEVAPCHCCHMVDRRMFTYRVCLHTDLGLGHRRSAMSSLGPPNTLVSPSQRKRHGECGKHMFKRPVGKLCGPSLVPLRLRHGVASIRSVGCEGELVRSRERI